MPEIHNNDADDLGLPEIINDGEAQGALAYAHDEPNRQISIQRLINTADIKSVFNSNTSSVDSSDRGVVYSETIIISSLHQFVLTTMAQNVG